MPQPPIIVAAMSGDKLTVRKLLEKDAGLVHEFGSHGNSPLHCAVAKETAANIAVIKILLEFKAECSAENDNGDTPLSVAKAKGHGKIVALLEEAAALEAAAEAARKKAAKEAKANAKKAAGGSGSSGTETVGGPSLQYRRTANTGWKPLKKDWDAIVALRKPLTNDLKGRKVAISFSNKAADAAFAKGLDALLKEAGVDSRLINKWPVSGWVKDCVHAADECDFVIVLHSSNYDDGHYCSECRLARHIAPPTHPPSRGCIARYVSLLKRTSQRHRIASRLAVAERFLVKESNVPHVVFELDADQSHPEHTATADAALALLRESVPLSQKERVETNTMPSTLTANILTREDKACYDKLAKVWVPKEGSHDALMLDLDALGDQALRSSAELAKQRAAAVTSGGGAAVTSSGTSAAPDGEGVGRDAKVEEALEVEELKNLFASSGGALSKRASEPLAQIS